MVAAVVPLKQRTDVEAQLEEARAKLIARRKQLQEARNTLESTRQRVEEERSTLLSKHAAQLEASSQDRTGRGAAAPGGGDGASLGRRRFAAPLREDGRPEFEGYHPVVGSGTSSGSQAPRASGGATQGLSGGSASSTAGPCAWGEERGESGAGCGLRGPGKGSPHHDDIHARARYLKRLMETLNAPIVSVDFQGRIAEWNHKSEKLTGFSREEVLGKEFVDAVVTEESATAVQNTIAQGVDGKDITNYEFPLFTKTGQRREILWSSTPKLDRSGQVQSIVGIGQDITEFRLESKMLANYVRICGAAVWSLRGNAVTGAVTDSNTQAIEHLISQQAQMDVCDPRMVLWRASFVSILKTMCQTFWVWRKSEQDLRAKRGSEAAMLATDFGYEFCFEAPNGSVKWYKVQGHLIQEDHVDSTKKMKGQFELTGSMQEVTSMLIDKVEGQRWQKWWNKMCHMVFDATLLVDTQEYRVLNAWGEEKVFGCQLSSQHPLLELVKAEDANSLKDAFNQVTYKGFERGRMLHLLRPGSNKALPAHCFLLLGDHENPNECMIGIRMQFAVPADDDVSVLWDVSKPHPVLTLEDLARLKSRLKRSHRRQGHPARAIPRRAPQQRAGSGDPLTSSLSLSSIPEDIGGEFEEGEDADAEMSASEHGSEAADSLADVQDLQSSSDSSGSISGTPGSSPVHSEAMSWPSREHPDRATGNLDIGNSSPFARSPKFQGCRSPTASPLQQQCEPHVKLRWSGRSFDLNLDEFDSIGALRVHIQSMTGVPPSRQTLILAGRRLPPSDEAAGAKEFTWGKLRASVRRGSMLMMVGNVPPTAPNVQELQPNGGLSSGDATTEGVASSAEGTSTEKAG